MSDNHPREPPDQRLESWKVIAAYLNRDSRTVMRWEQTEGLPVHRHRHLARSTVYAFPRELDEWQANRRHMSAEPETAVHPSRRRGVALAAAAAIIGLMFPGDARLSGVGLPPQTGPLDHTVDLPGRVQTPAMSPDGRYVSYIDRSTKEVHIKDLESGTAWQVTHLRSANGEGYVNESVVSHDSRFVAVAADDAREARTGIWIVPLSPSDPMPARLLLEGVQTWIAPRQWAPDDRQILFMDERDDRRYDIGLVSVADGSKRVLFTTPPGRPSSQLAFSPDGRFVAYDVPAESDSRQRDVYIVATAGGPPISIMTGVTSDSVVGWAPDGERLIVLSDRPGSEGRGLWALPLAGSRAAGEPTLLVPNFRGDVWNLTPDGTLFYMKALGPADTLLTARIDRDTGARLGEPELVAHDRESPSRRPRWSADGRSLLYVTARATGPVFSIQTLSSRAVREIPSNLSYIWTFDWSPDGRRIVCRCMDLQARRGIFMVDLLTGEADLIGRGFVPQFTTDGRHLTYTGSWNGQSRHLIERTLATGEERSLRQVSVEVPGLPEPTGGAAQLRGSPDGQTLLSYRIYPNRTVLITYDLRTDEARIVFEVERADAINPEDGVQWTGDGRALVANVRGEAENQRELWWIPVDGRSPHRLDIGVNDLVNSAIAVHPSGQQVAFLSGRPAPGRTSVVDYEFRVLEGLFAQASE